MQPKKKKNPNNNVNGEVFHMKIKNKILTNIYRLQPKQISEENPSIKYLHNF